jgi:hypothetical protein
MYEKYPTLDGNKWWIKVDDGDMLAVSIMMKIIIIKTLLEVLLRGVSG